MIMKKFFLSLLAALILLPSIAQAQVVTFDVNDPRAVVAVEWPKDALATWIPADARTWTIRIEILDDGSRSVVVAGPISGPAPAS